jgi:hypothetical protein
MWRVAHPQSKLKAMACAAIFAVASSALAKDGETRSCETKFVGQVVCGDLVIGITLEQYEAGLKKRAEEIRTEEAGKHAQLRTGGHGKGGAEWVAAEFFDQAPFPGPFPSFLCWAPRVEACIELSPRFSDDPGHGLQPPKD